jgi:hypothetical protein
VVDRVQKPPRRGSNDRKRDEEAKNHLRKNGPAYAKTTEPRVPKKSSLAMCQKKCLVIERDSDKMSSELACQIRCRRVELLLDHEGLGGGNNEEHTEGFGT